MNPRRDFFRKLAIGAVSLPAVVKVAMEKPALTDGPFTFHKVNEWQPATKRQTKWIINPAWESAPYEIGFWCAPESLKRCVPGYAIDFFPIRTLKDGTVVVPLIEISA